MASKSKKEWIELFTESVAKVWTQERTEFKKLAMILTAYHEELNRIKNKANIEFNELRNQFHEMETNMNNKYEYEEIMPYPNRDTGTKLKFYDFNFSKSHNNSKGDDMTKKSTLNNKVDVPSPDIFTEDNENDEFHHFISKPLKTKQHDSLLESSPSGSESIHGDKNLKQLTSIPLSPKIHKSSKLFRSRLQRRNKSPNILMENSSQSLLRISNRLNDASFDHTENYNEEVNMEKFKESNYENSVVDSTPEISKNLRKKHSNLTSTSLRSKLNRIKKNSADQSTTITQMFMDMVDVNKENSKVSEKKSASSSKIQPKSIFNSHNEDKSCKKVVSDYADNYDRIPEKSSSSPKHPYQSVGIRGKKRLNLKGWSCKDCKQYYERLDLPEDQLQAKMNKCSKHRSKYKPIEDTPPGFWDLTFPSTEDMINKDK